MRSVALDFQKRPAPFERETNWCVITGAPCSGKTTVLDRLADRDIFCVPEASRTYVDREMDRGRTLVEIRGDETAFQLRLIEFKLAAEQDLDPERVAVFDRGMPDSITYNRVSGLDPNAVLEACFRRRYRLVFLFDRLPLAADGVRVEDENTAAFLDGWLEKDYRALGYDVTRVPVMPVEDRVVFVVEQMQLCGLV